MEKRIEEIIRHTTLQDVVDNVQKNSHLVGDVSESI